MIRKAVIVVLTLGATSAIAVRILPWGKCEIWLTRTQDGLQWTVTAYGKSILKAKSPGGTRASRFHVYLTCMRKNHGFVSTKFLMIRHFGKAETRPDYVYKSWSGFTYGVTALSWSDLSGREHWRAVRRIQVPLDVIILLASAYPTIAFIRGPLLRWRRRKRGECVNCGYNLTGNVTGVCSECGVPI